MCPLSGLATDCPVQFLLPSMNLVEGRRQSQETTELHRGPAPERATQDSHQLHWTGTRARNHRYVATVNIQGVLVLHSVLITLISK